jgi:hypothetical protein
VFIVDDAEHAYNKAGWFMRWYTVDLDDSALDAACSEYYALLLLLLAVVTLPTVPACVATISQRVMRRAVTLVWSVRSLEDLEEELAVLLLEGADLDDTELEQVINWLMNVRCTYGDEV